MSASQVWCNLAVNSEQTKTLRLKEKDFLSVEAWRSGDQEWKWEEILCGSFPIALKSTQSLHLSTLTCEPSGSSEPGFSHQTEYLNSE